MTTLYRVQDKCLVCGRRKQHTALQSTNQFGPPDMDTRPPAMLRSTISLWIRCCPSCGYCAPQLSEGPEIAKEAVKSEPYRLQLKNRSYPKLANHFLCWAMIQEAAGDNVAAAWACLHAAWACDDARASQAAVLSRSRAAGLFLRARTGGASFADQAGVEEAILADVLRRSARAEQAIAMCEEGLKREPEETVRQVLLHEKALAQQGDTACHRVPEGMRAAPQVA